MSKKIMVALDNSDYANKVMAQAIELAKLYKTGLQGIAVIDDSYFGVIEDCCDNPYGLQTRDYWKVTFQDVLKKCSDLADKGEVDFLYEIVHGNPGETIIKTAEQKGIEIIVLGHLGKTAAQGFMLGSVAQRVAAYAKCSVFIVK